MKFSKNQASKARLAGSAHYPPMGPLTKSWLNKKKKDFLREVLPI
jgi:hypothetical protein